MTFTLITLLMLALSSIASAQEEPETYAVLVGVSEFAHAPDLQRPESKALCSKAVLSLYEHMSTGHVVNLCNSQDATRANVLAQLIDLHGKLKPGDNVLFVYTGLGVLGDWGTPVLLTHDFSPSENGLMETTLALDQIYEALRVDGVQVAMLIDASHSTMVSIPDVDTFQASGPIAGNVPEGVLGLSASSSVDQVPANSELFMRTLAGGLEREADLNLDGSITFDELNRYMVSSITRDAGMPPGVNDGWKEATQTVVKLRVEVPEPMVSTDRQWRMQVTPQVRKASWITSGTLLAVAAGSYAMAAKHQACLNDPCYESEAGYNQELRSRNTWQLIGQISGGLGLAGATFSWYIEPVSKTGSIEGKVDTSVSVSFAW